jgi:hypothetical protein
MDAVTAETSRAIDEDALAAYRDENHPCHLFADLQPAAGPGDDPAWELPVPFLGGRADLGLVFLGVNPSYRKSESAPRLGDSFECWDGWARSYFRTRRDPWPPLYQRYQMIGEAVFGPEFRLGQDAMVLDCIRFRSAAGQGTKSSRSDPVWEHELPITRQLLVEVEPKVVVTVGKDPLWAMSSMCKGLAPTLPERYRLRDYEFQLFTAELGGRQIKILPSRHLTAVWGAATPQIARVAAAIQLALSPS